MTEFLQTVIPIVLAGLLAGQIVITRIGRLRRSIQADLELLNTLPADHPSRATITAHSEKLVDKLIQRERRQFEPTAPARVPFSATEAIAVMMLTGVYAVVTHATGMNLRILSGWPAVIQGRWRFTRLSESSAGASRSGFGDSGNRSVRLHLSRVRRPDGLLTAADRRRHVLTPEPTRHFRVSPAMFTSSTTRGSRRGGRPLHPTTVARVLQEQP